MRPELKEHVEKFGALLAEAEKIRKHVKLHYGITSPMLAALVQGKRSTLDSFAEAAVRAGQGWQQRKKQRDKTHR